jgi:serine protease DegQ
MLFESAIPEDLIMTDTNTSSAWRALSADFASAVEKAGRSVVGVNARRRIPSSGVHLRPGIIVTADHALQREEEITITLPDGKSAPATLAGRDPSTDLAVLKTEGLDLPVAEIGDAAALRVGHLILGLGRTAEGGSRASLAMVGVAGPAWKTWTGGRLDRAIRLDRNLHPNLSGGPAIDEQGRALGINTAALSRFATVMIPASTVDRVTRELESKGRIGRGYIGVSMQPVGLPQKLRESLKLPNDLGLMVMGIEPESPADKAGLLLGDTIVSLDAKPVRGVQDLQENLSGANIGKSIEATLIRGAGLVQIKVPVAERPVTTEESGDRPGPGRRWSHGGRGGWPRRPN